MSSSIKAELLAPAGTVKNMHYAFAYGADAVYAGQPRYSLRVRNNDFNHQNLMYGIKHAHSIGKKFYVVVNIAPHNSKLATFLNDLQPIIDMQPDALIMSDPGLIYLVRENFPDVHIHLSVQANAINWASVLFWKQLGLKRIILSRELSIDEIKQIREKVPDIELEVFVHGALCMAYSGRCLLSGYLSHRDPNQGTCTNSCRWNYKLIDAKEDITGDIVKTTNNNLTDKVYLLEEQQRPGEYMSAFEDEHGTYIMNSKDLRAIQHINTLVEIGVHSLKIEGRTKSHFYVARAVQTYREAINDAINGKKFNENLLFKLDSLANRGYTDGFLERHAHREYQNYQTGSSVATQHQFVGEFSGVTKDNLHEVIVKNKFQTGQKFELVTTDGNIEFILAEMYNSKGEAIDVAPGDGHIVYIKLSNQFYAKYALLLVCLDKNVVF